MKSLISLFIIPLLLGPNFCIADQLVECHGTNIWNHEVIAQIFYNNGVGRILMVDDVVTVESKTSIEGIGTETLKIFDNDFVMNFSVSSGQETSLVQAFLQGAFYVEDFSCVRVE